jgi:tetratricopeptide (TPR) repeat protein
MAVFAITGCHTPSRSPAATSNNTAPTATSRPPKSANWPAEKITEAHAHFAAAVVHEVANEAEAALREYYLAAINDPDDETVVLDVSRRLLQAKQPQKALEILSRAADRPKASANIYARLGLVHEELGHHEQALSANRAALNKAPGSLPAYQNLYVLHLKRKQPNEATKVLDQAARQPNTDAEFLLGLGELYANLATQAPTQKVAITVKGLAVLNRAERLNPTASALKLRLADGFNVFGDTAKAAALYLDLLKTMPDVPLLRDRIRAKLAEIYLRGKNSEQALKQLEALARDEPTNPQLRYLLGTVAFEAKQFPAAAEHFGKTILLSPEMETAYYHLAAAQIAMNKSTDALTTLSKARQKFPANFVLEFWTGMAFSHEKAYAEAIQHYTAAEVIGQASEPQRLDEGFYFQLGAAYERKGDLAQAEKYFDKCLKLAPNFSEAMNYMGYMWAEHGMKLDQAKALIEKAVKAEPKNAAYLDSLGWVLFKLNQPKEALGHILKAVELTEEPDPTLFDHLGDIYAALNQPDKARDAWEKSLKLEANEQIKKKLEKSGGDSEGRNPKSEGKPKFEN